MDLSKLYYIPACNNKRLSYPIHLTSPTLKKGFHKASEITIVDCHTYYLRFRKNEYADIVNHYKYYVDFVKDNIQDESIIFVIPDWDWIYESDINMLVNKWNTMGQMKGNFISTNNKNIMDLNLKWFALGYDTIDITQFTQLNWIHNFSQHLKYDISMYPNVLKTYDSYFNPGINNFENLTIYIKNLIKEHR